MDNKRTIKAITAERIGIGMMVILRPPNKSDYMRLAKHGKFLNILRLWVLKRQMAEPASAHEYRSVHGIALKDGVMRSGHFADVNGYVRLGNLLGELDEGDKALE